MEFLLDLFATIFIFSMYINTSQNGFIALMSITIMSVVLLATTLSLAQLGIVCRYLALDFENKNASEHLAEACVHVARIAAYNNPLTNINNRVIPVGNEFCTIISITPHSTESTIDAIATRGTAVTTYRVMVNTTDGDFISWNEL